MLCGDDTSSSMRERTRAYRDTLRRLRLEPTEIPCLSEDLISGGEEVMTNWLKIHKQLSFTALMGCNDDATIGAFYALQHSGKPCKASRILMPKLW